MISFCAHKRARMMSENLIFYPFEQRSGSSGPGFYHRGRRGNTEENGASRFLITQLPNYPFTKFRFTPPLPPMYTHFHPRSPNPPKHRQRVATPKYKNPASSRGSKNQIMDRRRPRLRPLKPAMLV
jgi:hypothetical protein